MLTRGILDKCHELGVRENLPLIWLRLGLACGKVSQALQTVDPGSDCADLLRRVAVFRGPIEEVESMIDEWIVEYIRTNHDEWQLVRARERSRRSRERLKGL